LGQARECLFEKSRLNLREDEDGEEDEQDKKEVTEVNDRTDLCLELGQEAAYVGEVYDKVCNITFFATATKLSIT
jgi:hypothetical protein